MRILFLVLSLIAIKVQAQTVINYQTWSGSSGCNIFSTTTNVPATLNGGATTVAHLSTVGQPAYSTNNGAVALDGNTSVPIPIGTEYRIAYQFKQGHSYQIVVNAISIINSGAFPNLRLRVTNTTLASTSCSGPQPIDNLQQAL